MTNLDKEKIQLAWEMCLVQLDLLTSDILLSLYSNQNVKCVITSVTHHDSIQRQISHPSHIF